jgi:ABC-2 type transport system permease protein
MSVKGVSGSFIKFIAYLVVVVLINVAGTTLFFQADLTGDGIYSISEASRHVVSTLSEPLTIDVFFTKDLPAPYNAIERYLHDLLQEYAVHANRYFNYRFYDVSAEEGDVNQQAKDNQELAGNYGIHPVQIRTIQEDEVKLRRAYMGLVLIHGDMIERIPTIQSMQGLEYKLTMAMQKLNNKVSALLNLSDKVRVKLFLSSSLKAVAPYMKLNALADLPERVQRIVEDLNKKVYGRLAFEHLDPTTDPGLAETADKYNVLSLRWPALGGGEVQAGKGSIGLVLEYGDRSVTIQLIRILRLPLIGTRYELVDMDRLEEMIDANLESLIDINEDLGYLASNGALQISNPASPERRGGRDRAANFRTLVSQSYTIKEVNLKNGTIPEGINTLIIAGPDKKFTDYELFQIDQFLMRGKSLAVFPDAFGEVPEQGGPSSPNPLRGRYVPLNTGLEKLLAHYGVRIEKSYVMDENCYKQQLPSQLGGGERPIYFAPIIKKQFINHDLDFMKNIKGLIALQISPLALNAERVRNNGLRAYQLVASSEKSWEMSEPINLNPLFLKPPQSKDEQRSLPLAYLLEGRFHSYFAGKPIPEKESEEKGAADKEKSPEKDPRVELSQIERKGDILSKGKPGKIFVMASSAMLQDNLLDTEGESPNDVFIMNVIDYLNGRGEIAVMRSKEQRFNPLDDTRAGTRALVKFLNIIGLPVLVILFGLGVWLKRHGRKKRIKMMFQI